MSKAQEYGLIFSVSDVAGFDKNVYVKSKPISGAHYFSLASFLSRQGVAGVDEIIEEIDYLGTNANDIPISGYSEYERFFVYSQPHRAVYNETGSDEVVPMLDFLQILAEWKMFLQSLKFRHSLSNR